MAYATQIGLNFNLKEHWKMLFAKDTWFMYQNRQQSDGYVLRRLTVLNVFKWYFFQFIIWLLWKLVKPLALLADHYWQKIEGYDIKYIASRNLVASTTSINFFKLNPPPHTK